MMLGHCSPLQEGFAGTGDAPVVRRLPCPVGRFDETQGRGHRSPHDPFRLREVRAARYCLGDAAITD
jgi:hypothetical protein